MPNLLEVRHIADEMPAQHHVLRRQFLQQLHKLVRRDVIIYVADTSQRDNPETRIGIEDEDVSCFMYVISELRRASKPRCDELDLILHSPGGSLAATEQIVTYLRKQYKHIRVIVPLNAMSAATMLACATDEIIMGHHSALGPTDPQIHTQDGYTAAQSIINEFQRAKEEIKEDESVTSIWLSRIVNLPLGLLDDCERAIALSREMVAEWLNGYMGLSEQEAGEAADALSNADIHKTHDRPLNTEKLQSLKLKVKLLESDQQLQDSVLSVMHAITVTFERSSCFKIVENHLGKGVYQIVRQAASA